VYGERSSRVVRINPTELRRRECPLLERASRRTTMAHSTKIEWLLDVSDPQELGRQGTMTVRHEHNYTHIFRNPWSPNSPREGQTYDSVLTDHVRAMEHQLWHGRPQLDVARCISTCGGVYHYLGRNPNALDRIELYVLRPTVYLYEEHPEAPRLDMAEFLTEISLLVMPDRSEPQELHPPKWLLSESTSLYAPR